MIYFDMPEAMYRARGVHFSSLKQMEFSPQKYKHAVEVPSDSDVFRLGRAGHCASLEPGKYDSRFVVFSGRKQGKAWDQFEAEALAGGRDVLTEKEQAAAWGMANAMRSNEKVAEYLKGKVEVSCFVDHLPGIGELVHEAAVRLDVDCENGAIADLKGVKDASPDAFGRAAANYKWHAQAAFYHDVWLTETGEDRPFVFVAVEKTAPYACAVYVVPDSAICAGRDIYQRWLERLAQCKRTGEWPGYDAVSWLKMPKWSGAAGEGFEENDDE